MPRETITASDRDPFVVSVGWQRDHDVQLGIQVADPDRTIVDLLYGGEGGYLEQMGASLAQQVDAAGWQNIGHAEHVELGQMILNAQRLARVAVERDGIWANLNRRAINSLIVVLRRARDQAYGRDE